MDCINVGLHRISQKMIKMLDSPHDRIGFALSESLKALLASPMGLNSSLWSFRSRTADSSFQHKGTFVTANTPPIPFQLPVSSTPLLARHSTRFDLACLVSTP
eukprot:GHVN01010189.1.p2 GENE.GHVN01010189.1~~GHVN01010189.1.p2  ORF type:complete len:103 (+),score=10.88 GHVN01010189.1:1162-1470(+)